MSEVKTTTDYAKFNVYELNRKVDEGKIERIKESINKIDLSMNNPVIVDEDFQIIDGQHLFFALMQMKKPIPYTTAKVNGKIDDAIIYLNKNQHRWTTMDYVEHYAKKGKPAYKRILELQRKHHLGVSNCIYIVGQKKKELFALAKDGKLTIGDVEPERIAKVVIDFGEICNFNKHVKFVRTIVNIMVTKKYDHRSDFLRFKKNANLLEQQASVEQYLRLFEHIMNRYRPIEERVRLF